MKQVYRYYLPFRPPMPGAQPGGADTLHEYDSPEIKHGRMVWGYAEYLAPLTDEQTAAYELMPSPNNPLTYPDKTPDDVVRVCAYRNNALITVTSCDRKDAQKNARYYRGLGYQARVEEYDID